MIIDKVLIIDFGSQVTKLIARRIRDLGAYSEIINLKELKHIKDLQNVKGIILSGGPASVTKKKYPNIPKSIFLKKIPILGICYGLQLISKSFGGKVKNNKKKREFGRARLIEKKKSVLTKNFFKTNSINVWMSHQDAVINLPKGFVKIASTKDSALTIIENRKLDIYGIQFHPEITHTQNGNKLFHNFLFYICKIKKNWKIFSQKKKTYCPYKKKS